MPLRSTLGYEQVALSFSLSCFIHRAKKVPFPANPKKAGRRPSRFDIDVVLKLLSHESEALVSDNLELSILLLQELSNGLLVAITELELLVNETVVLEELSQTTLSDVLYHLLRHVGELLLSSLLLELDRKSVV